MAIETFAWRIQAASQPTLKSKDNIRRVQFGDGYAQVSGNGINNETLSYEFSFSGDPDTALEVYKFLRRHKTKAFSFKPPGGELALWRVQADSLQKVIQGKKVITITATFEQAFVP
ncbi:TPA: phage tail protein [Klebsiella pneumoniae]|uniref:phage tail protein n=1 Tax=Klebsiella pneumoniae TaxID=573 RepID=UPI00132FC0C9|nr:phage tail protein [Klebsiella pneumoniae]MCM6453078.1 phage tail protein [Klebsiella pneumoniae]HBS0557171.1 phage tail protein [Klebsiella pneumoniae]